MCDARMILFKTITEQVICAHVHDELIIECSMGIDLEVVCE